MDDYQCNVVKKVGILDGNRQRTLLNTIIPQTWKFNHLYFEVSSSDSTKKWVMICIWVKCQYIVLHNAYIGLIFWWKTFSIFYHEILIKFLTLRCQSDVLSETKVHSSAQEVTILMDKVISDKKYDTSKLWTLLNQTFHIH